ncbi:hypothetical protein Taro_004428 [Colocasia esculenta]|uniref:Condensin complex subunit 2 n=1 Tax=Colocasia esculenta TaxID=4460 RepID=A0A843TRK2_COLES|nr:hypothetical protein [Colocasia esculenta]
MAQGYGEVEDEQLLSPRKAARLLRSPVSSSAPLRFLGSNDDQLERAQARAARASAVRRKTAAAAAQGGDGGRPRSDIFGKEQIMELFNNCIKLASENKINQKNTWELSLIDHLSEIIRVESDDDVETNFQKASCTLEAGVKIYSLRVDSVHSEAYKVLGGINRAGRDDDKENIPEVDNIDTQQECITKKELDKKMSPLSTLESSFDALNVKKFDVAFTVDPLYHQTSAQFDEGGAKGLLLNNLGVFGRCRVLFDSLESPTKVMSCDVEKDKEFVDLSFARDYIEKMMLSMQSKMDISPTLREIVSQFDEDHQRPSDAGLMPQKLVGQEEETWSNQNEFESNVFADSGPAGFDEDDRSSVVDDSLYYMNANCIGDQEDNDSYPVHGQDADYKLETIANFLSFGLGFASKTNAWAGPDHWKYRKIKGPEEIPVSTGEALPTKKNKKSKKQEAPDIDFTRALDEEVPNIFAPPKNQKTTLLPSNRVSCSITLPEDCHYRPESLVKLILRPDVLCLGKKQRKSSDESNQQNQAYESMASWDNEGVADDHFDDGNYTSDLEETGSLVSQPRQVNKIEVQYDKSSKQVDVHALKETLWCIIKGSIKPKEMAPDAVVSFRQVLGSFYESCEASSTSDISPHLCFICLLHLANEHCLSIHDRNSLDELEIAMATELCGPKGCQNSENPTCTMIQHIIIHGFRVKINGAAKENKLKGMVAHVMLVETYDIKCQDVPTSCS